MEISGVEQRPEPVLEPGDREGVRRSVVTSDVALSLYIGEGTYCNESESETLGTWQMTSTSLLLLESQNLSV